MADSDDIPPWLPAGKTAAVCLSIDDVRPATSSDAYEARGDLGNGSLAHVERLLSDGLRVLADALGIGQDTVSRLERAGDR